MGALTDGSARLTHYDSKPELVSTFDNRLSKGTFYKPADTKERHHTG